MNPAKGTFIVTFVATALGLAAAIYFIVTRIVMAVNLGFLDFLIQHFLVALLLSVVLTAILKNTFIRINGLLTTGILLVVLFLLSFFLF